MHYNIFCISSNFFGIALMFFETKKNWCD